MIHPDGTPVPNLPEVRTAEVDAARLGLAGPVLSWREAGRGPAVLLLHGVATNSAAWRFLLAGLVPEARVIAWNAPGYVLSDPFLAEAATAEAYADAALALMEALGELGRVHVVGSAFGALVGIALAARYPERVATLSLLGPSRGERWRGGEARAMMLALRGTSIAEGGEALGRMRAPTQISRGAGPLVADLVRGVLSETTASGLMGSARCADLVDVVADFAPRVLAPCVVATGTKDAVNPPYIGQAIAAAIPFARFVAAEGIGHLLELEAPALTLRLLREHMGLAAR